MPLKPGPVFRIWRYRRTGAHGHWKGVLILSESGMLLLSKWMERVRKKERRIAGKLQNGAQAWGKSILPLFILGFGLVYLVLLNRLGRTTIPRSIGLGSHSNSSPGIWV